MVREASSIPNDACFVTFNDSPEKLFPASGKFVFLVGAGISMDPPSSLPSARMFVRELLEISVPREDVDKLLSIDAVRYEHVIELVKQMYDWDLNFFDYFNEVTEPNLLHVFLAKAIIGKQFVITTNFDYLIERALQRLLPKEKHVDIHPVINPSDYDDDPSVLVSTGKFPLYKVHGSKMNAITGNDCSPSLITTMSQLGAGKGAGETFGLEPFKKPTIEALVNDRTMIVMGYSGSDDFDITPFLKGLRGVARMVWIDHEVKDNVPTTIRELVSGITSVAKLSESRIDGVLVDIHASNPSIQIFHVRTNTRSFVRSVMWPALFPGESEDGLTVQASVGGKIAPSFREFIAPLYHDIPEVRKSVAACGAYARLGLDADLLQSAKKGLKIATENGNVQEQGIFLNFIASVFQTSGKEEEAIKFYQEALSLCEEIKKVNVRQSLILKETLLNSIGTIHRLRGETKQALQYFEEAGELGIESGSILFHPDTLLNLAAIHVSSGDVEKAAKYLDKVLEVVKNSGNIMIKAAALSVYGDVHRKRKDNDRALQFYQEALDIDDKMSFAQQKLEMLYKIGMFLLGTGRDDEAETRFRDAVEVASKLNNARYKSLALDKLEQIRVKRKELAA